jgi:hypothetical protein
MLRIRQVVFVVRDLAAASRQLAGLLALDPPYRDPGVAEFGIDNAVFAFGDQFIELISPLEDGTAAGRHLQRRGEGGYMLILQTDDFDRDRARIRGLGVRTVWEKELPDIRAMHLHPKDIGGAIVSIDQPVPAGSWRWGGPWRPQEGGAASSASSRPPSRRRARRDGPALGAGARPRSGAGVRRRPHRADRRLDRVRSGRRARRGNRRLDVAGGRPGSSPLGGARAGRCGRRRPRRAVRRDRHVDAAFDARPAPRRGAAPRPPVLE